MRIHFEHGPESAHELAEWCRSLPAAGADRRLLARGFLEALHRHLIEVKGHPPDAVLVATGSVVMYSWHYQRQLWIVFGVEDSGGWLSGLIGRRTRTIRFLRFLTHPPEAADLTQP